MADFERFEFVLPGYTPETMPLDRLIEYLSQLMAILGNPSDLHLIEIAESSTKPVFLLPHHAATKARKRARETWEGGGPVQARKAYRRIRRMVSEDGGEPARLVDKSATILEFPSVDLGADQEIGSIRQATSVTGELIRVGGETEFDQILVRDISGAVIAGCFATKEIGKRIAKHLHEYVRLHGIASWHRDRHGKWQMMRMKVQMFEKVDDESLSDALAAVQGTVADWPDDLTDQLLAMRGGEAA